MNKLFILAPLFLFTTSVFSKEDIPTKKRQNKGEYIGIAANCNPPTASAELNINNVKALIQSGGDMWWDFNRPRYEIPAGSGKNSLFAGSLWIGGQDVSGQFKVAAQRFRRGNDFWTGPLSTEDAEISPQTCKDYDRHWETSKAIVQEFLGWFEATPEQRAKLYPGYVIPEAIMNWPAHGRNYAPYNEEYYLAPFFDYNGDLEYNPQDGDFPGYVLSGKSDCSRQVKDIYGDQNLWWVFNDKGSIHTESQGASIGLEVRAQAFAFSSTDEVNNMTFYNYEIINQSTFSLEETYFGQWVDGDLGNPQDDYVGCDVQRGLGFFYNGDEDDEDAQGALGYGDNPPAIGVDFFQGPFQENDNRDNCLCLNDYAAAVAEDGIIYPGQGAGYGDNIVDNERYGMRKFVYFVNGAGATGDPTYATAYYNMLRGIWSDGTPMTYGGNGYAPTDPNAIPAHYMYPGKSDPEHWGTNGVDPGISNWTQESNPADDQRFVQSSGPFKLTPGAVNNITVGVVWAKAANGGRLASVERMRIADDKTQALFDSCFEILDGPDAPDVVIQELDREIILMLDNKPVSNNQNESYAAVDPFMAVPDSIDSDGDGFLDIKLTSEEKRRYSTYTFEGYQIFQLADASVGTSDLEDNDKARLVAQVDVKNDVTRLINYEFDPNLDTDVPSLKVDGTNQGIQKSFQFTTDAFATGDARLINHKTYYYMAIAYAYNGFGDGFGNLAAINGEYDPSDPEKIYGQKLPYLASRKSVTGPIKVFEAIPHRTDIESNGIKVNANYGDGVQITRVEGKGNSNRFTNLTDSLREVLGQAAAPYNTLVEYEAGHGPVHIKVVDPLIVPKGEFTLAFTKAIPDDKDQNLTWALYGPGIDTVYSAQSVAMYNEQVIDGLGISITTTFAYPAGSPNASNNGFIGADVVYEDETDQWLSGVADVDADQRFNWIKSGGLFIPNPETGNKDHAEDDHYTNFDQQQLPTQDEPNVPMDTANPIDPNQDWENIAGRTWAPFASASYDSAHPVPMFPKLNGTGYPEFSERILRHASLKYTPSVDVVITLDKSKWTRCPVFEAQDNAQLSIGGAVRGEMRRSLSVDKEGRNQLNPNCNIAEATLNGTQVIGDNEVGLRTSDLEFFEGLKANNIAINELSFGMGWFPGYAIDVNTGERLNMAFSEDSWLTKENGADMLWNPTDRLTEPLFGEVRFGGKHVIYVFRNNYEDDAFGIENMMGAYDQGTFAFERLLKWNPQDPNQLLSERTEAYKGYMGLMTSCAWTGYPIIAEGAQQFGEKITGNKTTIQLRASRPFTAYATGTPVNVIEKGQWYFLKDGAIEHDGSFIRKGQRFLAKSSSFTEVHPSKIIGTVNQALPLYTFSADEVAPTIDKSIGRAELNQIKAVPNPYYAYSEYETGRLDFRVKIINLPTQCSVNIFSVTGTLIRTFEKDDPTITSIDWDLKNQNGVPIVSGLYIIHIDSDELGEEVIKWYGVMRPADLTAF